MRKKLFLAKTLMLTLVLVAIFSLAENGVLAESPKVIHVDGTYTPAYPLPTASPTPTPAPTPEPTSTPTDTQDPTAEPTESETPTTNPTPAQTDTPTENPTQTSEPAVPELTLIAVIAGLTLAAAMALFNRKSHSTLKRIGSIAVLMAVLILSLMTNVANGQSPASSPSPVVNYSLWFTNATALPTDGSNCYGYENGGPFLNIGGIKPIASGFGSSADKTNSIIALRNDGNVPIDVSLELQNAQASSDIEISMHYFCMNNQTYLPYTAQWMGNSNVGENPLEPGQYMWLAITVTLAQPDVPLTGTPNHSFSYSFDIEVTATQA